MVESAVISGTLMVEREAGEREAYDFMYSWIHDLQKSRSDLVIDEALDASDALSLDLLIGLLTVTRPTRARQTKREAALGYARSKALADPEIGPEKVERLLRGL